MNNTSNFAAPTRRLLAGLIVTTIATASAGAWALTAVASEPTDAPAAPAAAAAARPVVVADAYHGVGFSVCRNGTDPIVVADAYHGIGVVVCR